MRGFLLCQRLWTATVGFAREKAKSYQSISWRKTWWKGSLLWTVEAISQMVGRVAPRAPRGSISRKGEPFQSARRRARSGAPYHGIYEMSSSVD